LRLSVALILSFSFLLVFPTDQSRAQIVSNQDEYDSVFRLRADTLIARVVSGAREKAKRHRERSSAPENPANVMTTRSDRLDLFEAAILIREGIDPELGNELIREQAGQPFRGGMFYIHDVMSAVLSAGAGVTDDTRSSVRSSLRNLPIYRGDTENHYLLYYAGLYLAAEQWPDEPGELWFNGRSSSENLADARSFFDHWVELTTTIGQGEFDSPTYMTVYLAPLLSLRQFALSPEMRSKAEAMLNWILADYAVEYLNGLYAGGHSRDYTYDVAAPDQAPSVGWGWVFFGGPHTVARSDNALVAWGDYRLPFVINNVANDRSTPYTQKERKRVRHIFRYGTERNPPVYKTTYMTGDYALGSLQGGILQPIQQHTWDVTFGHEMDNPTLFTLHPYYSGYELAMFFPEEIDWLTDQVDRYHLVYTDPDKWNSSSPYERTFQHDNSLIVLYNIADSAMHGHVDGFFPKALDVREEEESGWIFTRAGGAFVAVRPLQPYEWIDHEQKIENERVWRLRSGSRRNAFVVETAQASDFTDFDEFKEAVMSTRVDAVLDAAAGLAVTYATPRGDEMHFGWPEERLLNGDPVNLESMPLFEGLYLNGNDGVLTVSHGQHQLIIEPLRPAP
jgi:hypothetical protein